MLSLTRRSLLSVAVALIVAITPLGQSQTVYANEDTEVTISPKMEVAINNSLAYLAGKQAADGSWPGKYGKNVGVVSLCLMAFMSMGNLPGEGKYGHNVAKGVNWVIQQSQPSGLVQFTGQRSQGPAMYGHALATLMLSEVWGQTRRTDVGQVLRKAVQLILQVQGPKGGWGYKSTPQDGDTSVCVMQIIALKSAYDAGIYVPKGVIEKSIRLIKTRYDSRAPGFGYNNNKFNTRHMGSSAAGTCIMFITGEKDPKYTAKPLERMHKELKAMIGGAKGPGHVPYFLYYGSVASYFQGDAHYRRWNADLEKYLLKGGKKTFVDRGGLYKTSFKVLAAALPYRYIPVYQH